MSKLHTGDGSTVQCINAQRTAPLCPLITVGISAYNIEKYLPRAIDSVLAQTHENLEIIIVDDGSTDGTGAICDRYADKDNRIRVIHQENAGLGSTRNRVIEQAQGEYIAFLDGDDYVEPDMYAPMLAACKETGMPLAICRYFEERDDLTAENTGDGSTVQCINAQRTAPLCSPINRDTLLTLLIEEDETTPIQNAAWNKLYHRDIIKDARYPEHRYYEDIVTTTQILAGVPGGVFVDRPLYHYIIDREGSIMNKGVTERILTDQIPAYYDRSTFLQSIGRQDLADIHEYMVCKKLLLLYLDTEDAGLRRQLRNVIKGYGRSYDRIYACRIADAGQRLRMRLFLTHPLLLRVFTIVNDGIRIPLKRRKHSA